MSPACCSTSQAVRRDIQDNATLCQILYVDRYLDIMDTQIGDTRVCPLSVRERSVVVCSCSLKLIFVSIRSLVCHPQTLLTSYFETLFVKRIHCIHAPLCCSCLQNILQHLQKTEKTHNANGYCQLSRYLSAYYLWNHIPRESLIFNQSQICIKYLNVRYHFQGSSLASSLGTCQLTALVLQFLIDEHKSLLRLL